MHHRDAHLRTKLKQIANDNPDSLQSEVVAEALAHDGDIASFFSDLLSHGCESGMIGGLIYYHDTHVFYDKHYYEIEELRESLEADFGESLRPRGDLKNWYAWLGFEETARKIADALGIEY